ncbi:MAG TPA: outer membrane beta-barrel protein [Longimicrobium sp.]|nr:outer membrane beta-barrel protein [Longimicrobium sp.]
MPTQRTFLGAVLATAMLAVPAAAQTAFRPATVSFQAGGFLYGIESGGVFPMGAIRVDWPVTRFLRAEVGGSFARPGAVIHLDQYETPTAVNAHTQLFTATAGLQLELPARRVRPYAGVAAGVFARRDPSPGERFAAATREVMGGVRVPLNETVGVRGEVRLRLDGHQARGTSSNLEQTLGVTIKL